jgi:2-dehydro-3-deoxygluconokinase
VVAWDGERILHQPAVPVGMIDRLGAGDALAAGVIHGWLDGDLAKGLRYGTMLAALALSQHGDMVVVTPEELTALLGGEGGRLVR